MNPTSSTFIEHLTELRSRLIKSLIIVSIAVIGCYFYADKIFQILLVPLHQALGDTVRVSYFAPHEAFFTYLSLSVYSGLFIAFPFVALQIWGFVAPGLYKHEKQVVFPFLLATPIMFAGGAALAYFYVMPTALSFFADFQFHVQDGTGTAALVQETRIADYTKFALSFLFAFGVSFELPVLLVLLGMVGIVSADFLRKMRKFMIIILGIFAAIVTPPDILSLCSLWIPLIFLYELSILLIVLLCKKPLESL